MDIKNCELSDIDDIVTLYKNAIAYQKTKKCAVWPMFSANDITLAINEKRQFKIIIENKTACIFTFTFQDKSIWGDKDQNDAVYIHKIATAANFKGKNLVNELIIFSKKYAKKHSKLFLRMDTVGENTGLIDYYTKCGFTFLGLNKLTSFTDLPKHYHNATVSLFELQI